MPGSSVYLDALTALDDWTPYLLKHSGLPGPRGNLELAQAVAELADLQRIESFLAIPPETAPENTPAAFVVFCGVAALGKLAARGKHDLFPRLRSYSSDERWRIREAVAIGLQYVGDADMPALLRELRAWVRDGSAYELRAVAAALAEPRLLKDERLARSVLRIMDSITRKMASPRLPRDESFKVLRQGMAYCWSVAVAACPALGKPLMEKWMTASDADVHWVMKQNLKKNRLLKMDRKWTEAWQKKLSQAG